MFSLASAGSRNESWAAGPLKRERGGLRGLTPVSDILDIFLDNLPISR